MDFQPTSSMIHSLIDSHLELLDQLEGGKSVQEHRAELKERERQVGLALDYLRAHVWVILEAVPADLIPAVVEPDVLIRDLHKSVFIVDVAGEMLKAKGPQWNRTWEHYIPRIDEEFEP